MKGYDDDTTKTHLDRHSWGGAVRPAGCAGARTSQDERQSGHLARDRPGHLDRTRRRTTPPLWSPARPGGVPQTMATTVRPRVDAVAKGRGRSASSRRTGNRRASRRRAGPCYDHRVDHQLQRIDDVRSVDQRRFLVPRPARRILYEHTDQRATSSGLRLLRPSHLAHAPNGKGHAAEDIQREYPHEQDARRRQAPGRPFFVGPRKRHAGPCHRPTHGQAMPSLFVPYHMFITNEDTQYVVATIDARAFGRIQCAALSVQIEPLRSVFNGLKSRHSATGRHG